MLLLRVIWVEHFSQAVRQVYVLVLGLDVLGNPYALIHGIGEGFRDFFYEPYQVSFLLSRYDPRLIGNCISVRVNCSDCIPISNVLLEGAIR